MGKEIDHEYTEEIVCPYCGCEMSDSWECDNTGNTQCGECDKLFLYTRNISVSYSTDKAPCLNKEAEHNFKYPSKFPGTNKEVVYCTVCNERLVRETLK